MAKNYLWKQRVKFESTLALSMLEPWEKLICCESRPLMNCQWHVNSFEHVLELFGLRLAVTVTFVDPFV